MAEISNLNALLTSTIYVLNGAMPSVSARAFSLCKTCAFQLRAVLAAGDLAAVVDLAGHEDFIKAGPQRAGF